MRRRLSPVLASLMLLIGPIPQVKAQSQTVTWTDAAAMAGNCLLVATENGQAMSTGYFYYCPQQPTSYSSPYCYDPTNGTCYGSLYLPDLTLEGITTTYGTPFNVTKDTKGRVTSYSRIDQLVENQEGNGPTTWSGSITQSFSVSYGAYSFKCRCYPATTSVIAGGGGTLTYQGS